MKRIKFIFISLAIMLALGGAYASRPKVSCEMQPQYYKFGSTYLPAGQYGTDYVCYSAAGYCTYYLSNPFNPNSWAPCRTGAFSWLYKQP